MPVVTLGLNHKSAPLAVREQVVLPAERLDAALAALAARPGVREAAVLSTCNRTEIYAVLAPEAEPTILQRWLEAEQGLAHDWLNQYLYTLHDDAAISHLLRVTAGLDSLVLGEPQILGQAKVAYHSASRNGLLGQILERLFQHAFAVAKRVRTETDIGAHPVSVAFAAVTLARQIFGALETRTALLIGAGEMIDLTARHFHEQGIQHIIIANRSRERAEIIAELCGGQAIGLDEIANFLARADIVVSCTASSEPILDRATVKQAIKKRRHEPVFMADLAVPRDIEPSVERLDDVYLYTVDDLRDVIDRNMRQRMAAAEQAETLVSEQSEAFMGWVRTLNAVGAIRAYRSQAKAHRDAVLAEAKRALEAGQPTDEVLERLAHRLTRKLLHQPTLGLRDAARSGDQERIRQSCQLLGIPTHPDQDEE